MHYILIKMSALLSNLLPDSANDAHLILHISDYWTPLHTSEYCTHGRGVLNICTRHIALWNPYKSLCSKQCSPACLSSYDISALSWTRRGPRGRKSDRLCGFWSAAVLLLPLLAWRGKVSFCRRFVKSYLQRNHKGGVHTTKESLEANDNNREALCGPQLKQSTCNMKKFQAFHNLPNVTESVE